MEVYPEPRPVPENIPRPAYVPANFFSAPIWEHSDPREQPEAERIVLGSEGHAKARRAGRMAADVLREIGKLVRVSGEGLGWGDGTVLMT
jgi:methionyl aminopeptidase